VRSDGPRGAREAQATDREERARADESSVNESPWQKEVATDVPFDHEKQRTTTSCTLASREDG
jgi:hypothetical protein